MNKAKIGRKWINQDADSLFRAILKLNNLSEAQRFFRDLLTEKEILEFAQRWKVAKMLFAGKAYADIEKETGMSSTTIARIHRWLKKGTGGYKSMIKKQKYEPENFSKK
jgi:TrpR-related protein YerC/YecD